MKKLFEALREKESKYLSVWEDVCNIESPTDNKAGVDAVGAYFIEMAKARGWAIEVFEHPVAGNVVTITMNPEANARPFTFSGHMDTVHPVGSFGTPAVRIEGDRIYGPGVVDCKGGIVAAFYAMDALAEAGFTARPIQLILQSDEEGGGKYSNDVTIDYMCETAKNAIGFFNLEWYVKGKASILRKGIATYTFTVKGIEAHASACATQGASAILDAAYKIIEMEKLKDAEGLTCSCTVISGGTTHNTIAGECSFKANVRFANKEQFEAVQKYARDVASTVHVKGCTCEVVLPRVRPAMEYKEENVKLLEAVNRIWVENGLPALEGAKANGGSDAANISAYGIPCLDSLGVEGGNAHTLDEFGVLSSLKESATRMALVAWHITE